MTGQADKGGQAGQLLVLTWVWEAATQEPVIVDQAPALENLRGPEEPCQLGSFRQTISDQEGVWWNRSHSRLLPSDGRTVKVTVKKKGIEGLRLYLRTILIPGLFEESLASGMNLDGRVNHVRGLRFATDGVATVDVEAAISVLTKSGHEEEGMMVLGS